MQADVFGETFRVSVSFHLPSPPEYDVNRSPTNRLPFRRNSWKIWDAFAARKSVRATKLFRGNVNARPRDSGNSTDVRVARNSRRFAWEMLVRIVARSLD